LEYAQRAIAEYKKFAFLAVAVGHPVTPSDQVDQVWHLHLTYTRSYWEEFCPQILQIPLHHDPTRGGHSENQKFEDWYSQTLESYERFFGQAPPTDIWSKAEVRFGRDLSFVRVNTQQNWVLPKLATQRKVIAGAIVSMAFLLGSYYVGTSGKGSLLVWFPLILILGTAGLGIVSVLIAISDTLRHPSRPLLGFPDIVGGCGGGGCGGGGCGAG
jgi:hypothetical protein